MNGIERLNGGEVACGFSVIGGGHFLGAADFGLGASSIQEILQRSLGKSLRKLGLRCGGNWLGWPVEKVVD